MADDLAPRHTCELSRREQCGSYDCPGCERKVPCCFGASDELGELCDDCAAHVWRVREAAEALAKEGKRDE